MTAMLRLCRSSLVSLSLTLILFAACSSDSDDESLRVDAAPNRDASVPNGDAQPAVPMGPSPFGKMCDSAADCAPGLLCLRSDGDEWLGGGPAHGYCSLDCTDDASVCAAVDATASCLTSSAMVTRAYCMKGCVLGDTSGSHKCHDRQDVSCAHVDFFPSCMPNCGGDQDCPEGRHCDQKHGVCADGVRSGDVAGVHCDPYGPNTCDAYCASLDNGEGVCSGLCTLGAAYACNVPANTRDVLGLPMCVSYTGNRPGDAGICVQRCRCNDDCHHPAAYCDLTEAREGIGLCAYDFNRDTDAGSRGVACESLDDAATIAGDL